MITMAIATVNASAVNASGRDASADKFKAT